ncbi:MAG TPA: nucleotidyltransferase domain-containing protein [Rectinemataceae bacterium]|nr:nucleotidyltransferase domain-containing protein [Rectinemataceae bacterium]
MDQEQALKIARAFLEATRAAGYRVREAFLFRSTVRGAAGPESDIDIALMLDGMANSFDTQVDLMKLRRGVDLRIEPHPFGYMDEDPSGFLAEIKKSGVRVA